MNIDKAIISAILAGTTILFSLGLASVAGATEKPRKGVICEEYEIVFNGPKASDGKYLLCGNGANTRIFHTFEIFDSATRSIAIGYATPRTSKAAK